jgi:glycosyltransferase involved in cell wall biosynthesis
MKILVVGDGHSAIHEVAVEAAFKKIGHEVESFYWHAYFKASNPALRFWRRAQNKFLIGPTIGRLNRDLIKRAIAFKPDLIFIYRGTHVTPPTLLSLKRALPECELFGYNNDDPFAGGHSARLWRFFMKCIPLYNVVFAYRKRNIADYLNVGAKRVSLLLPWFLPEEDIPLRQDEFIPKEYDVVFVGHFEGDERIEYLKRIAEANLNFGLFGPDWDHAPRYEWLKRYQPVVPVRGSLYRRTLISAKIALCFLSTLNRDTYTRRCFEIPALGVFMLCQYSDDLARMFEDGVDAVFFRSPDDMMEKIAYYMRHEELREQIAANGRKRVVHDRHDIVSRMDYVLHLKTIKEL